MIGTYSKILGAITVLAIIKLYETKCLVQQIIFLAVDSYFKLLQEKKLACWLYMCVVQNRVAVPKKQIAASSSLTKQTYGVKLHSDQITYNNLV